MSSGASVSSYGSAPDASDFRPSGPSPGEDDNTLEEPHTLQLGVFGVLYTVCKEKNLPSVKFAFFRLFLDFLQLWLLVVSPEYGWVISAKSKVWKVVSFLGLNSFLADRGYLFFLVMLYIFVGLLAVNLALSVWVAHAFSNNRFDSVWPIQFLRWFGLIFYQVLDVATLSLLLMPLNCYYWDVPTGKLLLHNRSFPDIACFEMPHLVHVAVSVASIVVFLVMALLMVVSEMELNPLTKNYMAMAHTRVEGLGFTIKTIVTVASVVVSSLKPLSIMYLVFFAALMYLYVKWIPFTYRTLNYVRCASYATVLYCSVLLTVLAFDPLGEDTGDRGRRFRERLTTALWAGMAPAALAGAAACHLRLRHFDVNVLSRFRDADTDTHSPLAYRFRDAREVEIAARCCRRWARGSEAPEPEAVALSEAVIKAGMMQLARQPSMIILYSSFLIDVQGSYQSGYTQLESAKKSPLGLYERFAIFSREQEHTQKSSGASNGDAAVDLVAYVEFQRNYRLVVRAHHDALAAMRAFWGLLLRSSVDFNQLSKALHRIEVTIKTAERAYRSVLTRHSSSARMIRLYGKFLEGVKSDPWAAAKWYAEADRLEEEAEHTREALQLGGMELLPSGAAVSAGPQKGSRRHTNLEGLAAICINAQSIIQMASPEAHALLGYAKGELKGKDVGVIMPRPFSDRHVVYVRNYIQSGVSSILNRTREFVALSKSKQAVPVRIHITKVSGLNEDSIFLGVFEAVPQNPVEARAWLLSNGAVIAADGLFCDWLGYGMPDLVGQQAEDLTADKVAMRDVLKALAREDRVGVSKVAQQLLDNPPRASTGNRRRSMIVMAGEALLQWDKADKADRDKEKDRDRAGERSLHQRGSVTERSLQVDGDGPAPAVLRAEWRHKYGDLLPFETLVQPTAYGSVKLHVITLKRCTASQLAQRAAASIAPDLTRSGLVPALSPWPGPLPAPAIGPAPSPYCDLLLVCDHKGHIQHVTAMLAAALGRSPDVVRAGGMQLLTPEPFNTLHGQWMRELSSPQPTNPALQSAPPPHSCRSGVAVCLSAYSETEGPVPRPFRLRVRQRLAAGSHTWHHLLALQPLSWEAALAERRLRLTLDLAGTITAAEPGPRSLFGLDPRGLPGGSIAALVDMFAPDEAEREAARGAEGAWAVDDDPLAFASRTFAAAGRRRLAKALMTLVKSSSQQPGLSWRVGVAPQPDMRQQAELAELEELLGPAEAGAVEELLGSRLVPAVMTVRLIRRQEEDAALGAEQGQGMLASRPGGLRWSVPPSRDVQREALVAAFDNADEKGDQKSLFAASYSSHLAPGAWPLQAGAAAAAEATLGGRAIGEATESPTGVKAAEYEQEYKALMDDIGSSSAVAPPNAPAPVAAASLGAMASRIAARVLDSPSTVLRGTSQQPSLVAGGGVPSSAVPPTSEPPLPSPATRKVSLATNAAAADAIHASAVGPRDVPWRQSSHVAAPPPPSRGQPDHVGSLRLSTESCKMTAPANQIRLPPEAYARRHESDNGLASGHMAAGPLSNFTSGPAPALAFEIELWRADLLCGVLEVDDAGKITRMDDACPLGRADLVLGAPPANLVGCAVADVLPLPTGGISALLEGRAPGAPDAVRGALKGNHHPSSHHRRVGAPSVVTTRHGGDHCPHEVRVQAVRAGPAGCAFLLLRPAAPGPAHPAFVRWLHDGDASGLLPPPARTTGASTLNTPRFMPGGGEAQKQSSVPTHTLVQLGSMRRVPSTNGLVQVGSMPRNPSTTGFLAAPSVARVASGALSIGLGCTPRQSLTDSGGPDAVGPQPALMAPNVLASAASAPVVVPPLAMDSVIGLNRGPGPRVAGGPSRLAQSSSSQLPASAGLDALLAAGAAAPVAYSSVAAAGLASGGHQEDAYAGSGAPGTGIAGGTLASLGGVSLMLDSARELATQRSLMAARTDVEAHVAGRTTAASQLPGQTFPSLAPTAAAPSGLSPGTADTGSGATAECAPGPRQDARLSGAGEHDREHEGGKGHGSARGALSHHNAHARHHMVTTWVLSGGHEGHGATSQVDADAHGHGGRGHAHGHPHGRGHEDGEHEERVSTAAASSGSGANSGSDSEEGNCQSSEEAGGGSVEEHRTISRPEGAILRHNTDGSHDSGHQAPGSGGDDMSANFSAGKRFKKLHKILHSPLAQRPLQRLRVDAVAALLLVLLAHTATFAVLHVKLEHQKDAVKDLDSIAMAARQVQDVALHGRMLDALYSNTSYVAGIPDFGDPRDTALARTYQSVYDTMNTLKDLHHGVYLGFRNMRRMPNKHGLLAIWDEPHLNMSVFYDENDPVTGLVAAHASGDSPPVLQHMGLWDAGNLYVTKALDMYNNGPALTARGVNFTAWSTWRFIRVNGLGAIFPAYLATLDAMVQLTVDRSQSIAKLQLIILCLEGGLLCVAACLYMWIIANNFTHKRHGLYAVFVSIPLGVTRGLANMSVILEPGEEEEEDTALLPAGAQSDADADGAAGGEGGLLTEGAVKAGGGAGSGERKGMSVRLDVAETGATKGNADRGKSFSIAVRPPHGGSAAAGADRDSSPQPSARGLGALRGGGGEGSGKRATLISTIAFWRNRARISPTAQMAKSSKRRLTPSHRLSYMMVVPLAVWAATLVIVNLIGYHMLLNMEAPIATLNVVNVAFVRAHRVLFYVLEVCGAASLAARALMKGTLRSELELGLLEYGAMLYGAKGAPGQTSPHFLLAKTGVVFGGHAAPSELLYGTRSCLCSALDMCQAEASPYYQSTHNGLDVLYKSQTVAIKSLLSQADSVSGLNSTEFRYLWSTTLTDLDCGMVSMGNTVHSLVDKDYQRVQVQQIILFVISWGWALVFLLLELRPFLRTAHNEMRRIAELLSQLPPEVDVEARVMRVLHGVPEAHPGAVGAAVLAAGGKSFGRVPSSKWGVAAGAMGTNALRRRSLPGKQIDGPGTKDTDGRRLPL